MHRVGLDRVLLLSQFIGFTISCETRLSSCFLRSCCYATRRWMHSATKSETFTPSLLSTSNTRTRYQLAETIKQTAFNTEDEIAMTHRHYLTAVDCALCDLCRLIFLFEFSIFTSPLFGRIYLLWVQETSLKWVLHTSNIQVSFLHLQLCIFTQISNLLPYKMILTLLQMLFYLHPICVSLKKKNLKKNKKQCNSSYFSSLISTPIFNGSSRLPKNEIDFWKRLLALKKGNCRDKQNFAQKISIV